MATVALVGVTASGKSAVALEVAKRRGDCEIVSVDSMCVYRGMDFATAKPSRADRAAVPHHLIDVIDPDQEFTVSQFQLAAREALEGIATRGHHALLVGGTGLYLRAVLDGFRIPGQFPAVAASLREELDEGRTTVEELHRRLGTLDPLGATRMESNNRRRVVRALEVTLGSGQPFSAFGPGLNAYPPSATPQIGLTVEMDEIDRRITSRLEEWMRNGLIDEVRALVTRPSGISRTARQALGYRELLRHVEEGEPLEECLAAAALRTRQFARRQASWFRRDPRIEWVESQEAAHAHLEALLEAHD